MSLSPHRFYPASPQESIVFGAQRPGYPGTGLGENPVQDWIAFMQSQGIRRVLCLLPPDELARYYQRDLLEAFRQAFGVGEVGWAPVENYHLCPPDRLQAEILPFLNDSAGRGLPVVVHCSGGLGRTGHILAAWLAHGRGFTPAAALAAVIDLHRDPYEAVEEGYATQKDLLALLGLPT